MIELVLETFLSGYRDGANNSFNDWFRLIAELIQPSGNIVLKVGSVCSKSMFF